MSRDFVMRVVRAAAKRFDTTPKDVMSGAMFRNMREARCISYWISLHGTKASSPRIGQWFGRDHTSILKGARNIEAKFGEPEMRGHLEAICAELGIAVPEKRKSHPPTMWTDEAELKLIDMVENSISIRDIAEALKSTMPAIRTHCERLRERGLISEHALQAGYLKRMQAARRTVGPRVAVKIDKPERPAVQHLTGHEAILASMKRPVGTGIPLRDLRTSFITQCRMPFLCDDGETRYCGERATDGSWCAAHAALVFSGAARPTPRVSGRSMFMEGSRA